MKKANYQNLASNILSNIGGKDNIENCIHCMTRLRFTLKDESLANTAGLEALEGVLGCKTGGGQIQVIIGNAVSEVYEEVCNQAGIGKKPAIDENLDGSISKAKKSVGQSILDYITNAFIPLVPALVGSGVLKGLLSLFTTLGWLDASSATYAVLSAAGNAVFYFIPIFIAYNTAKYLKTNVVVAMVVLGALMEPNFTALLAADGTPTLFGLPLTVIDYSSLLIPALVVVPLLALLEKGLNQIVPKSVRILIVPFVCLVVMVPLTALVLGPATSFLTNVIASASDWLNSNNPVLLGIVVGGTVGYLTMLGLHMALLPVILLNFTALGSDPVLAFMSATCYAQIGVGAAIWLRTKDKELKSLAGASTISALIAGVTEPILFGLCVKHKPSYVAIGIAGAVGGGLMGMFGCKAMGFVNAGLLGLSGYYSDRFVMYVISIMVTTLLGFILTNILAFGKNREE